MFRQALSTVLILATCSLTVAQEQKTVPLGPPPSIVRVTAVEGDHLVIEEKVPVSVQKMAVRTVEVDGEQRRESYIYTHVVYKPVSHKLLAKTVRLVTIAGKEVELAKAAGQVVLRAATTEGLDAAYKKLFAADALILVPVESSVALGQLTSKVVDKIKPALVTVQSSKTLNKPDGKKTSLKNVGIVLDPKGLVVAPLGESRLGAEVKIVLADGRELPAKVIHADAKSGWGVFEIKGGKALPTAEFANSEGVEIGDTALALGWPDGSSTYTVSIAIVSAKDRRLDGGETVLQVDSSVGPGLSPGIVIDAKGNFLGVLPNRGGIGFAVPSNRVKDTVTKLAK